MSQLSDAAGLDDPGARLLEVARLEEARVSGSMAEVSDIAQPWEGGFLCRGAPGLWCNAAFGAGMHGPARPGAVGELIEFYTSARIEPRIELCPFAADSLRVQLEASGFVLRAFELVLYRRLSVDLPVRPEVPTPADLRIEVLDATDETALRACAAVVIPGFKPSSQSDDAVAQADFALFALCARHPRVLTVVARLESVPGPDGRGAIVGVGSAEVHGETSALFGAVVVKDHRRRGVQQAMLAARLNLAAERGARLATIGSRPHVGTQRNVLRMGFAHAYTKVILAHPGPGLTPVEA